MGKAKKSKIKNIIGVFRFLRKIPKVAWVGSALFGIFTAGFLLGAVSQSAYLQEKASDSKSKKDGDLSEVLNNYQGLSKLFYLQQQDMDIITDTSQWSSNPQELTDAISSYRQKKNEILFQWGRLYELRRKAGLPSDQNLKME